jgi:hypothetical protein
MSFGQICDGVIRKTQGLSPKEKPGASRALLEIAYVSILSNRAEEHAKNPGHPSELGQ